MLIKEKADELDASLRVGNGKFAVDKESYDALKKYSKEYLKYNEEINNGKRSSIDLIHIIGEFIKNFYCDEYVVMKKNIDSI